MNRRACLAVLASATSASLAGCTVLGDAGERLFGEEDYDIGMSRNEFLPEEYEITVGDTVVWKNTSSADHTVTAYENAIPDDADYFATGGFESESEAFDAWERSSGPRGRLGPRDTFEHTFEVPGTYSYVCIPHRRAGMDGVVIVSE